MDLSVVICTHNGSWCLERTLGALAAQIVPKGIAWEVILVDNASTDGTAEIANRLGREIDASFRVVDEPKAGQGHAIRTALGIVQAPIVSLVDDDNLVSPRWVHECVRFMEAHPEAGLVGGRVELELEEPAQRPVDFETRFAPLLAAQDLGRESQVMPAHRVLVGAGLTGRTDLIRLVDFRIGLYLGGREGSRLSSCNDLEMGHIIRRLGWQLWFTPDLTLRHVIPSHRLTDEYIDRLRIESNPSIPWLLVVSGQRSMAGPVGTRLRAIAHAPKIIKYLLLSLCPSHWHPKLRRAPHWRRFYHSLARGWWILARDHQRLSDQLDRLGACTTAPRPWQRYPSSRRETRDERSAGDEPSILVVIVNYRVADLVIDCLRSLMAEVEKHPGLSISVVDNGSQDGSVERLEEAASELDLGSRLRVVAHEKNLGFSGGCNAALRVAWHESQHPEFVYFLNPDTQLIPGALDPLLDLMARVPDVGIAGSRLEDPDGQPKVSAFRFPSILRESVAGLRIGLDHAFTRRFSISMPPSTEEHSADWLSGAALFVRAEVLEAIGPFDEVFFLYYEDTDICRRASEAGFSCRYVPTSRAIHLGGQSTAKDSRDGEHLDLQRRLDSRRDYFLEHHGRSALVLADLGFLVGRTAWRLVRRVRFKPDPTPRGLWRHHLGRSLGTAAPVERLLEPPIAQDLRVAAVVIGRNEGDRLERCLQSLEAEVERVVYVDSGSVDGSAERARSLGAEVVELDTSKPFTAARARNAGAGRLLASPDRSHLVQFVDADCQLTKGWIAEAVAFLGRHPEVVTVFGRLRELKMSSIFQRLLDLEFDGPVGDCQSCGGVTMMRLAPFGVVGGFDESVAAGEEPELCRRLRRGGGRIYRIAAEMGTHDSGITGFGACWRRAVRTGRGYGRGSFGRHDRMWIRESASAVVWGLLLPLAIISLAWPTAGWSLLGFGLYPAQVAQIVFNRQRRGTPGREAILWGLFCVLAKLPMALGVVTWRRGAHHHNSHTGTSALSGKADANRNLRLFYAAGPGDVIGTYRSWRRRRDDPSQTAVTYPEQFFELRRRRSARAEVVACCPRHDVLRDQGLIIRHRRVPWSGKSGIRYHAGQIAYGLYLVFRAWRFRADVAIVQTGTHWCLLGLLPRLRIAVVPSLHSAVFSDFATPPLGRRFFLSLSKPLFRSESLAILTNSETAIRQLADLTGGETRPISGFLPTYRPATFSDIGPLPQDPFRVLFAGRIEERKGVFDLLEVARRSQRNGRATRFEFCGEGSALEELQRRVENSDLSATVEIRGHLPRRALAERFEQCHLVVVPTQAQVTEGLNKSMVEGVLSGRPVVVSRVCSTNWMRGAVIDFEPEDVDALEQAIERLRVDGDLYERTRRRAADLTRPFYEPENGWDAALDNVLQAWLEGREPESRNIKVGVSQ